MKYITNDFYKYASWEGLYMMDNVHAVTIKFKPEYWEKEDLIMTKLYKYCIARKIDYILYTEVGGRNNLHVHGTIIYPSQMIRKRYQTWINAVVGYIYHSTTTDPKAWLLYCTKNQKPDNQKIDNTIYMF